VDHDLIGGRVEQGAVELPQSGAEGKVDLSPSELT
jgi:hypothetical protein